MKNTDLKLMVKESPRFLEADKQPGNKTTKSQLNRLAEVQDHKARIELVELELAQTK